MTFFAELSFVFAACFIAYSLIGYPLLLFILARWRSRPLKKQFGPRRVTIILPVHNGENWIGEKLRSIAQLDYPRELIEILVLSDGSTDRTEEFASQCPDVQVISLPKSGKAAAVNRGIAQARGEILFFTDVRQPLAPDCLRELVACFGDPDVGGVCGELMISNGSTQEEASVGLYWRVEKWIRTQLSGMGTLLVVTGCLYAIRRELAEQIPSGALGDDIFMPQAILRKGYRVVFNPAAKAFDYPTARKVEFGRKVRTLAALYQFLGRFGLGAYPFHFFSYKVTRLLLPYMLAIVAVASFFLPAPFAAIAVGAQVLFYGLAALDRMIPEGSTLKRAFATVHTFCMLMTASLCAASVLFVPSAQLWKPTRVTRKLSG